jgi:thiamine-phosphate pyrophosphorylase
VILVGDSLGNTVPTQRDITPAKRALLEASSEADGKLAALRILDANLNRATEGLRVIEDYCRFALDDRHLTQRCKQLRHDLVTALEEISTPTLAAARESQTDVGAEVSTPQEGERSSLEHVAAASWQRVQQALRVIDECLKLVAPDSATTVEQLRYQAYTLAKACTIAANGVDRLTAARVIVLFDGAPSERSFLRRLQSLIAAGVPMLQLREKRMSDRKTLERARLLRQVIDDAGGGPLLVINDRVDLAVLARADGVHIGQDELTVRDARKIVGAEMLIGVSTHNMEQARQAVLDGANYIGCGPVFPSSTKQFKRFPGVNFLKQVAAEISLPAFAIGGIRGSNLHKVLASGFTRIAVGSAVMSAQDRSKAARTLLTAMADRG